MFRSLVKRNRKPSIPDISGYPKDFVFVDTFTNTPGENRDRIVNFINRMINEAAIMCEGDKVALLRSFLKEMNNGNGHIQIHVKEPTRRHENGSIHISYFATNGFSGSSTSGLKHWHTEFIAYNMIKRRKEFISHADF